MGELSKKAWGLREYIEERKQGIESKISLISSMPTTIVNSVKGLLTGGMVGFTATNITLLFVCPAVGYPIAINLSLAGTVAGSLEGLSYSIGSDSSMISKIKHKFQWPSIKKDLAKIDKGIIDSIVFKDVEGFEDINHSAMKVIEDYKALPVLDLEELFFVQVEMPEDEEEYVMDGYEGLPLSPDQALDG
jgi:hypothetical protein